MRETPCPCKQDCPNRNAHCRMSCMKYKIYEHMKGKEYEERQKQREKDALEYSYVEEKRKRIRKLGYACE